MIFETVLFADEAELRLWYRQPAQKWEEALPVGNGRLGAMVFGGVREEHLQLNESSVWSENPKEYNRIGAWQCFPKIRRLIWEGKHGEAEALIAKEVLGERPLGSYQPLGDLLLSSEGVGAVADYSRELAWHSDSRGGAQESASEKLLCGICRGGSPEEILSSPGKLVPVEVKWTENPSAKDARHLIRFIGENKNSPEGYVVCRCLRPMKLTDNVTAIPWHCL
jgi:hypothetical protein